MRLNLTQCEEFYLYMSRAEDHIESLFVLPGSVVHVRSLCFLVHILPAFERLKAYNLLNSKGFVRYT